MNRGLQSFIGPILLAVLIFASDFIGSGFFQPGELNFAVWFVLSVFSFGLGWFIKGEQTWQDGSKSVFIITSSVAFISVVIVMMLPDYFSGGDSSVERLLMIALRNFMLGLTAVFGLILAEVFNFDKEIYALREKVNLFEETIKDAKKESDLIMQDARAKADLIIANAELSAKNTIMKRDRIEKEIKEFIQIEKELIKKYEEIN